MFISTKKNKTINADKNTLNTVKPVINNKIQNKSNKKIEFHRSLEAFSDCV
jgi:hypothetical protein